MAVGEADFRTCSVTGLKVHLPAERLIKINAVTAVVFILVGGIVGLSVALTRWPTVHLLPAVFYYRLLTLHGIAMLIAWIIFFEIAAVYFCCTVLLNSRLAAPKLGWLAYILMLVGAAIVAIEVLMGRADVMFTSYVPLKASPWYYLGIILFAVGALIGVCLFFASIVKARIEGTYTSPSLPLVSFGVAAACIIAVLTLAHGAIIIIPTFLWSLGLIDHIDPATYRIVFWGFGHSSQQINVAAMISVWYLLGTLTVGAKPVNQRVCRTAFILYILFINIASAHHILVDPGVSSAWKVWNTSYAAYLAVLASMIHALAVPASIEIAQRKKGYTKGLFEWLIKAPWGNPGFSALVLSILGFGILGGITGVVMGTEQLNIRVHNTLGVTGHFHGTVVAGTTLAFMGLTYYVIPLLFRRELISQGLAKIQPYLFAIGITLLSAGMMFAGMFGVPRRHWDITFANSLFPISWDPTVSFALGIVGLGGILAALGGAIYIYIAVGSLLFGKRTA